MARVRQASGWELVVSNEEMLAIRLALQYASLGSAPGTAPTRLDATEEMRNTMNELLVNLAVVGPTPTL